MNAAEKEWLARPTITPPELRQVEGTRLWEFTERYEVSLPPPRFPLRIVIPAGWRYDRSSIPSLVPKWIMDKDHLGTLAPAPHDAGYKCRGQFALPADGTQPHITTEDGTPVALTVKRDEVDAWFLLYLLRQRIPSGRARMAYWAVRRYWGFREFFGLSKRW